MDARDDTSIATQVMQKLGGGGYVAAALGELNATRKAVQDKQTGQRKMKIVTHALGSVLSLLSSIGYLLKDILVNVIGKFILGVSMGFISLATDLVALVRKSYVTHQARKAVKDTEEKIKRINEDENILLNDKALQLNPLQKQLLIQCEERFKGKVKVAYTAMSVFASLLMALSFICPPLFVAGGVFFLLLKAVEYYDRKHGLEISRWVANCWGNLQADAHSISTADIISTLAENNLATPLPVLMPQLDESLKSELLVESIPQVLEKPRRTANSISFFTKSVVESENHENEFQRAEKMACIGG